MRRSLKHLTLVSLTVVILGFLGLALQCTLLQAPSSGTWAPAPGALAEARSNAAAAALADGSVLVTGGDGAAGSAVASAELFSLDGSFYAVAPMSFPRSRHVAVALKDGRVLVAGGNGVDGNASNSAEIFDPASGAWQAAGAMLEPRADATATRLSDGRVLIAGGANGDAASMTLEVFDPVSDSFVPAGVMSSARKDHAAALLAGDQAAGTTDKVLLAGGSDGASALASTEVWDAASGSVAAGPALSVARSGLSATTLLDGSVLLAGGAGASGELALTEVFSPASGLLELASSQLAAPRQKHLAIFLPHNSAVLFVGGTAGSAAVSAAELYMPWAGGFVSTGQTAGARADAAASAASDGLVVVAGGKDAAGAISNSADVYGFATVKTDKDDYAPYEIVTITGGGWESGDDVILTLHETNNPEPHPDRVWIVTADANGNLFDNAFYPEEHDLGIRFMLTAEGARSQAQMTFTDSDDFTASPSGAINLTKNPGESFSTTITYSISFGAGMHLSFPGDFPVSITVSKNTGPSWTTVSPTGSGVLTSGTPGSWGTGSSITITPTVTVSGTVPCSASPGDVFTTQVGATHALATNKLNRPVNKNVVVTVGSTPDPSCDTTPPTVTINQAAGQGDPTNTSPVNFTAMFSEPVSDFATGDVTLGGSAGATTQVVTEIAPNDGTTYNVAVSGMTVDGTVIASIAAGVAHDAANNPNDASTSSDNTVTYDTTPPVTTFTLSPSTSDGQNGWYVSNVHVTVSAADNLSGVEETRCVLDGAAPANFDAMASGCAYLGPGGADVTTDGMHTVYAASKDNAGNKEAVKSTSFKIDKTPPNISVTGFEDGDVFYTGSPLPTVGCSAATDPIPGSGVASTSGPTITAGGLNANGVGSVTYECTATDNAGNVGSDSRTFSVRYGGVSGILQPIKPDNSSIFKRGQAVPVKFQLAGDEPLGFDPTGWQIYGIQVGCSSLEEEDANTLGSVTPSAFFRYDPTADQYIYNADFRSVAVGTCWRVRVTLDDAFTVMDSAYFKVGK